MTNVDPDIQPTDASPQFAADRADETVENAFILRVSDTRFLVALSILVVGMLSLQVARSSGWGRQPVEIQRIRGEDVEYRIDINRSRWVEWAQLPDIGETTARRIIADRDVNGPFESVDDIGRVPGIGPATLANLRPWLTIGKTGSVSANKDDVARIDSNQ